MKINVVKKEFLKYWGLAERLAGVKAPQSIFSTVLMCADFERTELRATNIRTAVTCKAEGVTVIEPGLAVIPVKRVSELFSKAGADEFTVDIRNGNATMTAGRSRYHFTTYPVDDFPKLPAPASASPFFEAKAGALAKGIEWGMLCASPKDMNPRYMSAVYFDVESGYLNLVSTDNRRMAMSQVECVSQPDEHSTLLPCAGIHELQRILGQIEGDTEVSVALDDAQAYFTALDIEFSIRKVEGKFPPYKKALPKTTGSVATFEKTHLLSALDRIKVVVGDSTRIVKLAFENDDECVLSGTSKDFGEAVEVVPCSFSGESTRAGFDINLLTAPVNLITSPNVSLSFESPDGYLQVKNQSTDESVCLIAPIQLGQKEDTNA
jgi:DNA polymerase-3 subunit beta